MGKRLSVRPILQGLAAGMGLGVAAYLTSVGIAWRRYGNTPLARTEEADPLLDRFMPVCEAVERHHIRIAAPAGLTFAAASDLDLTRSGMIQAIFHLREVIFRTRPEEVTPPKPLLAYMNDLGWGRLDEIPGREVVLGAVTQPWNRNVVFRAVPPDEFLDFDEPGYVKIVLTLRADPAGAGQSMARTETRVMATDPRAREKFRWYWSCLRPGILLIRKTALRLVKNEAERRARLAHQSRISLQSS